MAQMTIAVLSMFSDNYAWMVHDGKNAVVIDPGEAEPVSRFCNKNKLVLTHAIITHHHSDHCGGAAKLKASFSCSIIGPKDQRMLFVDDPVGDGDTRMIFNEPMDVIATPGHTKTHCVYHFPKLRALFTGDTLFSAGCGRLLEGTALEMWQSLKKCTGFEDNTLVYCGHEYTEDNLMFAASIDPDNKQIWERIAEVKFLQPRNIPTVPSTLLVEKTTNLFLRSHDAALKNRLGMKNASDVDVFAELRKRRDSFS